MPLLQRSDWCFSGFQFRRLAGRAHAQKSLSPLAGAVHNRIDNLSNPAQISQNRLPSRFLNWFGGFDRSPELLDPLLFFVSQANPPVLL